VWRRFAVLLWATSAHFGVALRERGVESGVLRKSHVLNFMALSRELSDVEYTVCRRSQRTRAMPAVCSSQGKKAMKDFLLRSLVHNKLEIPLLEVIVMIAALIWVAILSNKLSADDPFQAIAKVTGPACSSQVGYSVTSPPRKDRAPAPNPASRFLLLI
jgi:hypothetical protein